MKMRVFKKYGNRKLYCTENSKYVTFNDLIDCIRDGYRVAIIPHGKVITDTEAILNGSRHILRCVGQNINTFSDSTVVLLMNVLYDSWLLQSEFDFGSYKEEERCIN